MQLIVPKESENFPLGQDVHIGAPVVEECEPFGQGMQCDAAWAEYMPAGQAVQLNAFANEPAWQGWHR